MNNVPGWMSDPDLEAINNICARVSPGAYILEIGSFLGRSSAQWASNLPTSTIICVDAWIGVPTDYLPIHYLDQCQGDRMQLYPNNPTFNQFLNNMRHHSNIIPIRMNSQEFSWVWNESPAVIFIDGDHTDDGVKSDLDSCFTKWQAQPHTIICGHDYDINWNTGVYRQVNSFATTYGYEVILHNSSTVWELRKSI